MPIKDANDLASSPAIFKVGVSTFVSPTLAKHFYVVQNTFEIASVAPSSVGILVADVNGRIYILDKSFEPIRTWAIHVSGRVTHMVERKGILITVGVRPDYIDPVLGR